jgi:hypothetical protein
MRSCWARVAVAIAVLGCGSGVAWADSVLITSLSGNDCSGVFGQGFRNCAIPDTYDPDNTPAIIKFNANGSVSEVNDDLFPTISGSEFSFSFGANGTGSWVYSPGAGDPSSLVSFFVAKGGPGFNLFSVTGNGGSWVTPTNPANGRPFGLSHLTFYNGGLGSVPPDAPPVPEPATLLLVGGGLAAASRLRRLRRSAEK